MSRWIFKHMIGTEISRVSLYSLKGIVSLSEFVSIGSRLKQILFSPGKGHNLGKRSETKKQIKPIRKQSKIWSLRYDHWPKLDMKIAKAIQNKCTMLKSLEMEHVGSKLARNDETQTKLSQSTISVVIIAKIWHDLCMNVHWMFSGISSFQRAALSWSV